MITAIAQPPARPRFERKETPPVQALPEDTTQQLVKLFKLLSDGTRLQIIHFLTGAAELNVGNLCDLLDQSQPAVSHHLALLRDASIVDMRRDGKHNFYRLRRSSLAQYQLLVNSLWDGIAAANPPEPPSQLPTPLPPTLELPLADVPSADVPSAEATPKNQLDRPSTGSVDGESTDGTGSQTDENLA
jgi:DNA-binding transcriptional ArsR family regulator